MFIRIFLSLFVAATTTSFRLDANIVGGHEVKPFQYPWMASLQYGGRHFCGGSLLNETTLITAAHCSQWDEDDYDSLRVQTHRHDLRQPLRKENGCEYEVTRIKAHPKYNKKTVTHDFAYWTLSRLTIECEHHLPISLHLDTLSSRQEGTVRVIGWGLERENAYKISPILKEVDLDLIDNTKCQEMYALITKVDQSMVCAGVKGGGKDTCSGDSGGSMFIYEDGKPILVGITSWGAGCGRPQYYGVYARIAYLLADGSF